MFTRDLYRAIFLESLKYCQKEKGLVIHAYVIMTNHVHMIISRKGTQKLDYLQNNPVEQGFVTQPENFPWSSMRDYCDEAGLIEIERIGL